MSPMAPREAHVCASKAEPEHVEQGMTATVQPGGGAKVVVSGPRRCVLLDVDDVDVVGPCSEAPWPPALVVLVVGAVCAIQSLTHLVYACVSASGPLTLGHFATQASI